jgi:hypothetical protein
LAKTVTIAEFKSSDILPILEKKYATLMALTQFIDFQTTLATISDPLANPQNVLPPGVYNQCAAWSFLASSTLIFNGLATDKWVIQIVGTAAFAGKMELGPNVVARRPVRTVTMHERCKS